MAKEGQPPGSTAKPRPKKLERLSKDKKIQKRPLLHPSIAGIHSSSKTPRIIYVSSKTPFISALKRAQKYFDASSKTPGIKLSAHDDRANLRAIEESVKKQQMEGQVVTLKGTGKAIEKVLQLGMWFQDQDAGARFAVIWRTASVGAVDDVVQKGDQGSEEGVSFVEESRIRRVSVLEVDVSLK
ncbi:hypothetical protein BP6252_05597 [Coleophoma cylindrospora]|uniref:Uncharacterized protein n=1 Tax=Coleophoma cylindrospora TaxID=1849047 RepID=A0A3D8RUL4_9HELO|nr:hypothetical protein BP6252_05597 [Coleophoma cylindrospora]